MLPTTQSEPISSWLLLQLLLGDEVPDVDSGKRDLLLDTQCAGMLYFCYKDIRLCSMCRLSRDPSL